MPKHVGKKQNPPTWVLVTGSIAAIIAVPTFAFFGTLGVIRTLFPHQPAYGPLIHIPAPTTSPTPSPKPHRHHHPVILEPSAVPIIPGIPSPIVQDTSQPVIPGVPTTPAPAPSTFHPSPSPTPAPTTQPPTSPPPTSPPPSSPPPTSPQPVTSTKS